MIIYFSGTGNCLQVATQVAKRLNEKIISIVDLDVEQAIDDDVVGFVFPVYNYDLPNFVRAKLQNLKFNDKSWIFCIIGHGGDKGNAIYTLSQILESKGCRLSYGTDLLLPVNSRIMYGRVTDKIEERLSASNAKIDEISDQLFSRENNIRKIKKNRFLAWMSRVVEKESVQKYFTPVVHTDLCINCGICIQVCPVGNIIEKGDKTFIEDKCVRCMTCMHWCPQTAIHFNSRRVNKAQQYHNPNVKWTDIKVKTKRD